MELFWIWILVLIVLSPLLLDIVLDIHLNSKKSDPLVSHTGST
jgi:hypothetical protein